MIYFDSALLNVTERLCHWFQRLTGRTNVWLALQLTNLSVIVYFTGAAMYFWSLELAPRIALGLFCAALLYTLTQTVFRVPDRGLRARRLPARVARDAQFGGASATSSSASRS